MTKRTIHERRKDFVNEMFLPLGRKFGELGDLIDKTLLQKRTAEIVALYQAGEYEKQKRISEIDSLTGVYRRRALENWALEELAVGGAVKTTIVFFDIDNFKRINDKFGHSVGDEALANFSLRLQEWAVKNFGPKAKIGRWGGEEFVVIISDKDSEEVMGTLNQNEKSEKENRVFNVNFTSREATRKGERQEFMLTASIGLSTLRGTPSSQFIKNELNRVIKEADSAMYYRKKNGKNGAVIYSEDMSEFMEQVKEKESKNKAVIERAKADAKSFLKENPLVQGKRQVDPELVQRIKGISSRAFEELSITEDEEGKNLYMDALIFQLAV